MSNLGWVVSSVSLFDLCVQTLLESWHSLLAASDTLTAGLMNWAFSEQEALQCFAATTARIKIVRWKLWPKIAFVIQGALPFTCCLISGFIIDDLQQVFFRGFADVTSRLTELVQVIRQRCFSRSYLRETCEEKIPLKKFRFYPLNILCMDPSSRKI